MRSNLIGNMHHLEDEEDAGLLGPHKDVDVLLNVHLLISYTSSTFLLNVLLLISCTSFTSTPSAPDRSVSA